MPQDLPDLTEFAEPSEPSIRSRPPRRASAALPSVDPRLDSFVSEVIKVAEQRTGYRYKLGEGARTPEQQAKKVRDGVSWTYNSKHLKGRSRDVVAFDGDKYLTDAAHPAYTTLGDVYREKAASAPVRVRWGVVKDGRQVDPGHFELDDDDSPSSLPDLTEFAEPSETPTPEATPGVTPSPTPTPQTFVLGSPSGAMARGAVESAASTPAAPLPDDGEEVERVTARNEVERAPRFGVLTMRRPAGVADWRKLSPDEFAREGYRQAGRSAGLPSAFVEAFLERHGPNLRPADLEAIDPAAPEINVNLALPVLNRMKSE